MIPGAGRHGQFKTWLVCQFCGRVTSAKDSEGWLNQPHRDRLDVRVVRCPPHISEWALRHTREGRTKDNRELLRKGHETAMPPIPPYASPFPLTEQTEEV